MSRLFQLHDRHLDDASQMSVIDSEERRIYVTAPAGYGKTSTMTTKALELLASGAVPYPKKILCITFSVNAARGMRISISSTLDRVVSTGKSPFPISNERFLVTNYHGLSRKIIKSCAAFLDLGGIGCDALRMVDDARVKQAFRSGRLSDSGQSRTISDFCSALELRDFSSVDALLDPYRQIILEELVPKGYMTYNGLLVLAIHLLESAPAIHEHLRLLYPCVMVDEAQDMNHLHWRLLNLVQNPSGRLLMFGDPIQRIYGFLGAIPKLEAICERELGTVRMELLESHRFKSDSLIGRVERCVRTAACGRAIQSDEEAIEVPILISENEYSEGALIARLANHLASSTEESVAILFKTRCNTAEGVRMTLQSKGIGYFDGLFDEKTDEYNRFNDMCLDLLVKQSKSSMLAHREALALLDEMIERTESARFPDGETYCLLLNAFKRQLTIEFKTADPFDRYDLVYRTFSERSLRNAAGYLDTKIALMTVHSAKGLEWQNVIIAAMCQYGFPSGRYCYRCAVEERASIILPGKRCTIRGGVNPPNGYEDELNAFYVAVSRSREGLYLSIPRSRLSAQGSSSETLRSCFLQIPGFRLKHFDDTCFPWNDNW